MIELFLLDGLHFAFGSLYRTGRLDCVSIRNKNLLLRKILVFMSISFDTLASLH
jgi:hypothetical protein